jgi:LruC domain-containing protein
MLTFGFKMKKKVTLPILIALAAILTLTGNSCRKLGGDPSAQSNDIEDMVVSPDFKFKTTQDVGIKVYTLDNTGSPVPNMRIDIYTDTPENGGSLIVSGMTNSNGLFSSDYKIAAGTDSLAVGTMAIGFCNMQKVKVVGGTLNLTLGGKSLKQGFKSGEASFFKSTNAVFYPIGPYNSNGVPNYLEKTNDIIDAATLQDINATLPEYKVAPVNHPQYFISTLERNLVLNDACNVWVTFVHEGAGYRNVLGYYTYKTGNPPATPAAIDSVHIIFPNVSFSGSGGGLASGNKVHLGIFAPGTEIGWVLIADGFRGTSITSGNWVLYSDKNLNPEADINKKEHTILLNDIGRGKFLLSFEDQRRDGSTDNDFNDAVFYVTADPISAVSTENIPIPSYVSPDADKDGISDVFDNYPSDPLKAFNNYYPSKDNFGTLAFEDLWPSRGDYDFNDMVVDYNFNQITNGQNKVVQVQIRATLTAMGASYENGFGIQLPISPDLITSVTGTNLKESYIVQNSNGTEAGQSKATIILFDNGYNMLPYPGSPSVGVNTTPGATYVTPKELNITINFTTPVSLSAMGLPPYNPFMIINRIRNKEVHLIDNPPTDLADNSLLGTSLDNSNPATGRYYVTKNNLPFAIDISSHFDYPVEKVQVTQAFLKFVPWSESSGSQYFDWFQSKAGYRFASNIFSH